MKDVHQGSSPGTRIRFFVETGRTDVPMVCIADNYHFPIIINYSARERKIEGHRGVLVDVIFQRAVSAEKNSKSVVAVNIWQPGLEKRKYKVWPSDGRKLGD
jgi:hypothetical protein